MADPPHSNLAGPLRALSDDELLGRLSDVLRQARRVEAEVVAHVGEVDARRLYAREATPSMFAYCTDVLQMSEHEAYLRITVARAARERPVLLIMLREGRLHLSAIAKLSPHLTDDNHLSVLARASGRSKREIQELVAELEPRPDAPPTVRKLPERRAANPPPTTVAAPAQGNGIELGQPPAPAASVPECVARPATVEPLSPARYRVQFTASVAFREKIERLQELMRASVPDGDLARLLEQAVTEKLARLEAKRFGASRSGPARHSRVEAPPLQRYIPAAVRRAVYDRDRGRCRFVDDEGRRCRSRTRLEFHHVHPFARGGRGSLENIRLMCRAHNSLAAERDYGAGHMARVRRTASGEGLVSRPPP